MMDNESRASSANGVRTFILLAFILLGFIATTWLLGYIWALIFSAVAGGYVLWTSMRSSKPSS